MGDHVRRHPAQPGRHRGGVRRKNRTGGAGLEADEELLRHAVDHFSEDRILIATDHPHFDYLGTLKEITGRSDITKKKEKIVSHDAREFLRM